jgi:HD-GYP domain-containing protein (c-di-GMP phosphodiesterase class II)
MNHLDDLFAERPYRGAMPVEKTLSIMAETVGTAVDEHCFASLKALIARHPEFFPNA